jgi:hypothetical protein
MQATKWLTTNYLGDIAVTVNEKESLENKIEYHLNENFIKTEEVELFLFDLNNINYSNGLLGADKETLTNLWTSENSVMERPLYEIFAMCKFRKYGRTIHRLKGTILTDIVLKPFCIITDNNLQRGGQNMKFLLNHFTWDLNRGTYDIEAEEYSEEDVTVDGVTYDSEGNPEVITPVAPTNLSLIKYVHFGAIFASWNPVGGSVIGYKLQRKPYYSPLTFSWVDSYKTVYIGTSTFYFDTPGILIGPIFSYRVCAYNAEGDGAYSAVETITW